VDGRRIFEPRKFLWSRECVVRHGRHGDRTTGDALPAAATDSQHAEVSDAFP
jgi:hypothetical protein